MSKVDVQVACLENSWAQKASFGPPWLIQYLFTVTTFSTSLHEQARLGLTEVQEVEAPELDNERRDRRALIGWDDCSIGKYRRRRCRVKLPGEVTVLLKRAVTVVRPETVEGPAALGQELSLCLKTSPGVPELRRENYG